MNLWLIELHCVRRLGCSITNFHLKFACKAFVLQVHLFLVLGNSGLPAWFFELFGVC